MAMVGGPHEGSKGMTPSKDRITTLARPADRPGVLALSAAADVARSAEIIQATGYQLVPLSRPLARSAFSGCSLVRAMARFSRPRQYTRGCLASCFAVVLHGAVPAAGQRGVWGCLEPVPASGRRIARPACRRSRGAAWLAVLRCSEPAGTSSRGGGAGRSVSVHGHALPAGRHRDRPT
jgi:hypothetical protein